MTVMNRDSDVTSLPGYNTLCFIDRKKMRAKVKQKIIIFHT